MGRIIEGVWDCVFCGTDKIRGSEKVCPVCGKTRGQDVKFYMDNPKNYVADDVAKNINRNPDWLCSYCDTLNGDELTVCHNCGADREKSSQSYFENRAKVEERQRRKEEAIKKATMDYEENTATEHKVVYNDRGVSHYEAHSENPISETPKQTYRDTSHTTKNTTSRVRDYTSRANTAKPKIDWKKFFGIAGGILGVILFICLMVGLFSPKVMDVTVTDLTWERSIGVETLTTVQENGWSLPSGGRLQYTQQEIKTYEKVLDHYETKTRTYTEQVLDHYEEYVSGHRDLGNGYFEEITSSRPVYRTETRTETYEEPVYRDEPVYATKYYYEIDKWLHSYNSVSKGHKSDEMYWNEPDLKNKQRESGRTETCYIHFINDKEKTATYTMNRSEWDTLSVGENVTLEVVLGHATIYTEKAK